LFLQEVVNYKTPLKSYEYEGHRSTKLKNKYLVSLKSLGSWNSTLFV